MKYLINCLLRFCFLFIPVSLLVFRVRIGPSGCNVSLNVPMRADSLGLRFGDAESGTEISEEPCTEMGEERTDMGEALTGVVGTKRITPSIDNPGR